MNIAELIKELQKLPQDATIGICEYDDEWGNCTFDDIAKIVKNNELSDFEDYYTEEICEDDEYTEGKCDYYLIDTYTDSYEKESE